MVRTMGHNHNCGFAHSFVVLFKSQFMLGRGIRLTTGM